MDAKDLLPVDIEFDDAADPQIEAVTELEEAARRLDLEPWILNKLRHCERELTVNIPVLRDDGTAASFTALRMQHVTWRGPSMGPISFSPTAHVTSVRAAAMKSTWQAALLDLRVGGAAGAVVCEPQKLSERELHELARGCVYGLRGVLGRHSDVVTYGVGCNDQIMSWMLDAHAQTLGRMEHGAVTGQPATLAGLPLAVTPIARGVLALLRYLLATRRKHASHSTDESPRRAIAGQRVSIQGFGSLGSSVARILHENGARVIAVADISGAVLNEAGLDIPGLQEHAARAGMVFGFPGGESGSNADALEADCDMLITAATERQVTAAIANKVKASIVLSATNEAITHHAEILLEGRDVTVIPDVLATAGGLIGSYLEWKQAEQISPTPAEELEREIERRVVAACKTVLDCAATQGITPRCAAKLLALDRIAKEMRLRN